MLAKFIALLRAGSTRKRQRTLIDTLIGMMPAELQNAKSFAQAARFHGFDTTDLRSEYAYTMWSYREIGLRGLKQRGTNLRITGVQATSLHGSSPIAIDLFIHDGLLRGVRIESGDYDVVHFNPALLSADALVMEPYAFPPTDLDRFVQGLDPGILKMLDTERMTDVNFNGRTYFTFHDLEDGNYLALDRSMRIWSLVHDAEPMAKLMKVDLKELLADVKQGRFNADQHLAARYGNTRN